jgi:hypothetical protein
MSIARGNHAKGQPAHMNTFAFRHNVGSKKTARIARLPVHTMCNSCTRVILWKKKCVCVRLWGEQSQNPGWLAVLAGLVSGSEGGGDRPTAACLLRSCAVVPQLLACTQVLC